MHKKWNWILGTVILLLLVYYVIRNINFYEIYETLKKLDLKYFILAFLSGGIAFFLWALRGKYSYRKFVDADYFFLLKVIFAGAFFNIITPSAGVGGEPVRAYFLSKKYKKSKTQMLGCVLGDKFFHLIVFAFFIILSISFVLYSINLPYNLDLILKIILFVVIAVIIIFLLFLLDKFNLKFTSLFKKAHKFWFIKKHFIDEDDFERYLTSRFKTFSKTFKQILRDKKTIYLGVFLALLFWLSNYLISYFMFLSFGNYVPFFFVIVAVTLGTLAGDLSPIPGGAGIIEGGMVIIYTALGINFSLAIIVALFARLIYYFYSLVIGGYSLVSLKNLVTK